MKKVLAILLIMVMVLGIFNIAYATEVQEDAGEEAVVLSSDDLDISALEEATEETEEKQGRPKSEYIKAKVVNASEVAEQDYYGMTFKTQEVKVVPKTGDYKGKELTASFYISQDYYGVFEANELKKGDVVYIDIQEDSQQNADGIEEITTIAYVVQEVRDTRLIILGIIVLVIIIALARVKGLETLAVVFANTAIVVLGFVYLYGKGLNSIISLLIITIVLTVVDLLIMNKASKESFVAAGSVVISTIIVLALVYAMNSYLDIIGLTEYGSYLGTDAVTIEYKYVDLLTGGMLVATLGSTIYVALRTVKKAELGKPFVQTLEDALENLPMKVNSSFMPWLGTFITVFMVFLAYNKPIRDLMNVETVSVELIRAAIILLNPVIVAPIAILLGKELLHTRTIGEPAKDVKEEK